MHPYSAAPGTGGTDDLRARSPQVRGVANEPHITEASVIAPLAIVKPSPWAAVILVLPLAPSCFMIRPTAAP